MARLEPGPFDDYIDQVFGWAERLRKMDLASVADRFGIDDAALAKFKSPTPDETLFDIVSRWFNGGCKAGRQEPEPWA